METHQDQCPNLEDCFRLLKGERDKQRLTDLLLITKFCKGDDISSLQRVYDAIRPLFLDRLLICPALMVCSCCLLYVLRCWRIISFKAGESSNSSDAATIFVSLKTLRYTLPLAGTYLFYMIVTIESVRGANVPIYTTLRRTTVVFTILMEYILAGQRHTSSVVFSVGLIVFGAFIAGAWHLSFDAYGYAVVLLSNITTAIYLATIAREKPAVLIALALCGAMV